VDDAEQVDLDRAAGELRRRLLEAGNQIDADVVLPKTSIRRKRSAAPSALALPPVLVNDVGPHGDRTAADRLARACHLVEYGGSAGSGDDRGARR
jgi:hypothetical protein